MITSQLHQPLAETPSNVLRHAQSDNQGSLRNPVSIDRDGGEGDVNDAAAFVHFSDEIGVERRRSSIEEEHPFAVQVLGFSDSSTDSFRHFSTFVNVGGLLQ